MPGILLPMFSPRIFKGFKAYILAFILNLFFVSFIFLQVSVQYPHYYLLNRQFLPHCMFLPPLSSVNWLYKHGFISGFSVLFHWSVCLFLCYYHAVLITMVLWYSLILGSLIPPTLFFPKIAMAIHNLLWFHISFWIFCSSYLKYVIDILIGTALNL